MKATEARTEVQTHPGELLGSLGENETVSVSQKDEAVGGPDAANVTDRTRYGERFRPCPTTGHRERGVEG